MWLTPPSIAFCKATALLAPVAMIRTSLAYFVVSILCPTKTNRQNADLHKSLNPHRQRHLRHSIQIPSEKPRIRSHRLLCQSLYSCPGRQAGPGLVESDMPVCADSSEEQIDSADGLDLVFERGALGFEVCRVAVEDIDIFAGYVDVGEEI